MFIPDTKIVMRLKHKNNPDSLAGISFLNSAITGTIIGLGGGIDYVNISSIGLCGLQAERRRFYYA